MGQFVWVCALVAACSFSSSANGTPDDASSDASIDAPPANPSVRVTSVTSSISQLRPGLYGFEVSIVVDNGLAVDLDDVRGMLALSDGTADRAAAFRWRDFDRREGVTAPPATTLAAGTQATLRFKVDAMPWAIPPGPILVNGLVTFVASGIPASATPLDPALSLPFIALPPPIVVDEADDEQDADSDISFREALAVAAVNPGIDRITFDPSVFPTNMSVKTVLDETLGPLPVHDPAAGDLVIDGSGAGFVLAADASWESPSGRYGFQMSGGSVVIYGIRIENMAYHYPYEDVSLVDCGTGQKAGGAIRVDGGTFVLQASQLDDSAVAERNCYAASLDIAGGAGHLVLDNTWTGLATDAIQANAGVAEISGNLMTGTADPNRSDDCILLGGTGSEIWIAGNICVDHEFNGLLAGGTNAGTVHVVHNTFVRNGRVGNSAIKRNNSRTLELRNNVYVTNNPTAIQSDNDGLGFDIAYEGLQQNPLCMPPCPMATIDMTSLFTGDVQLVNPNGSTRAELTPAATSPLVDSGAPWLDRNGRRPGWHGGTGPERGAIEVLVSPQPP